MQTRKNIKMLEEESFYTNDSEDLPPNDIVAYNELRSCADIYRMYTQEILQAQPEFQREVVWDPAAQTRFIDSIVKQLPIPSMCFAYDPQKQSWMVIDGLQRISTIVKFLAGGDWRLSELHDIDQILSGKSVAAIKTSDPKLHHFYTRVENLSIPITVLRCDYSKRNHLEYLFTIFHRLNSTGVKLNNQEIRNCIYAGTFNRLLKELDNIPEWRQMNKMKPNNAYRFVKQELILRILSFSENYQKYSGRLSKFLNDYMQEHRYIDSGTAETIKKNFGDVCKLIYENIFESKTPPKISLTVLEALFVAVTKNFSKLRLITPAQLKEKYRAFINLTEFSEGELVEGLAKKQKVIDRISAAIRVFS